MQEEVCNYLSSIAISVIIALILTLLFFNGLFLNILYAMLFSLILALLSLLIIAILGASDNGFTRTILCKNAFFILISIIRKYIFKFVICTYFIITRKCTFCNFSGIFIFLYVIKYIYIIYSFTTYIEV